ncbi:MAG: tRNA (adenosine(37)-N6)-threonylcarbamoyltransferase complex ATPase subunit type 1 TsaE [Chloroflexi bacterium]|nr:tRNA (adenosine(37)-N6)-threonylcarbamoyltransferase complex ATPase subunit type 1 TsaE [Chloroflexota bacterium]
MAPILTDNAFDIITHSPEQTARLGELLGRRLQAGDLVCLQGDLGSGKTCFTQGIGIGLDVRGSISSPTFVLVNEVPPSDDGPYLYHIDLYRILDVYDALSLGLEEYVHGDGVVVIEWAERVRDYLPAARLWITLTYLDENKRCLLFQASGPRYIALLDDLRTALYGHRGPGSGEAV